MIVAQVCGHKLHSFHYIGVVKVSKYRGETVFFHAATGATTLPPHKRKDTALQQLLASLPRQREHPPYLYLLPSSNVFQSSFRG